jgi:hypothetical protein
MGVTFFVLHILNKWRESWILLPAKAERPEAVQLTRKRESDTWASSGVNLRERKSSVDF